MSLEFKEAPPPPPDAADRRVLDAQVQLSVKNYDEAATIALDVVEKYPNTRAYDDALYLLGEALFQGRDYYSARHYLQEAVAKNNGSKAEQQALQRLVEVALRTGDYENVDVYLKRLENVPASVDGAERPLRPRQVPLLPQPARRGPGGLRVDSVDQPLLLSGALLPGDDHGQAGRPGRRVDRLRRSAQAAAARRRGQGHSGPGAAGDRPDPLRAVAVRQGDRGLPRGPAAVALLVGGAARAGLDLHQGEGLAARLSLGEPAAALRSRYGRCARPAPARGKPRAANEQLLSGQRRVQQGPRRVRADPPPAAAGHRQVADRSRPTSIRWSARASTSSTSACSSPPPPPSG